VWVVRFVALVAADPVLREAVLGALDTQVRCVGDAVGTACDTSRGRADERGSAMVASSDRSHSAPTGASEGAPRDVRHVPPPLAPLGSSHAGVGAVQGMASLTMVKRCGGARRRTMRTGTPASVRSRSRVCASERAPSSAITTGIVTVAPVAKESEGTQDVDSRFPTLMVSRRAGVFSSASEGAWRPRLICGWATYDGAGPAWSAGSRGKRRSRRPSGSG
jgi:hypothetical protein